jgi:hypothetical protein
MGTKTPRQLSLERREYLLLSPTSIGNQAKVLGASGRRTSGTRNTRRLTGTLHEAPAFMVMRWGRTSPTSDAEAPRVVVLGVKKEYSASIHLDFHANTL